MKVVIFLLASGFLLIQTPAIEPLFGNPTLSLALEIFSWILVSGIGIGALYTSTRYKKELVAARARLGMESDRDDDTSILL